MHKVTFKMTAQDRLAEYNARLAHASMAHQIIQYGQTLLSLIISTATLGFVLLMLYQNYHPFNWLAVRWPSRPFSSVLGWLAGIFLGSNIFWSVILDNSRSVRLFPEHVVWKRRASSNTVGWQDVTAVLNTGWYIEICFRQSTSDVIVVPKVAFASLQGVEGFYETALAYWCEARGPQMPPVPDTSGVWPPAPRPGA